MEPKIESPQQRKLREDLIGQLTLEELQHAKKIRDEAKAQADKAAEQAKLGDVLFYCIYHQHYIAKDNQRKKREVAADNTVRYVPDPDHNHTHYQIENNRFWVPRSDLTRLRNLMQYRQEYIEAIDLKDGDPRAMSLEQMLDTPRGDAWLANMVSYSKRANVRPPLSSLDVRLQIKRLRAGTEKSPKENRHLITEVAVV